MLAIALYKQDVMDTQVKVAEAETLYFLIDWKVYSLYLGLQARLDPDPQRMLSRLCLSFILKAFLCVVFIFGSHSSYIGKDGPGLLQAPTTAKMRVTFTQ